MAKFIKFPLTGAQEELLIPVSEIANVETVSTSSSDSDFANGTKKFTITHVAPLVANEVVLAIYAAIKANPGGVVSTVGAPIAVAQVLDSTDGRQLITTPQSQATYTSFVYGAA